MASYRIATSPARATSYACATADLALGADDIYPQGTTFFSPPFQGRAARDD